MKKLTLTGVRLGMTHDIPVCVEQDTLVFRPITGMSRTAPLRITSVGHGIPDGWRVGVMGAAGMVEMNAPAPLRDTALKRISVVDADTIEFPGVNAERFKPYTSGGQLVFYPPLDLSVYSIARMDLKKSIMAAATKSLSTSDATIEIDAVNSVVWIHIRDDTLIDTETLASIPAITYLFDIELETASGVVTALCSAGSTIEITPEITTS